MQHGFGAACKLRFGAAFYSYGGTVRGYRLNLDVELLVPLQQETLQKTFDKKLWLVPPRNTRDITQLHYGIKWSTGSDHLFWNEYFAYIHFNESNDMTGFEISTEIARDWNE